MCFAKKAGMKQQLLLAAILTLIPVLVCFEVFAFQINAREEDHARIQIDSALEVYRTALNEDFKLADAFLNKSAQEREESAAFSEGEQKEAPLSLAEDPAVQELLAQTHQGLFVACLPTDDRQSPDICGNVEYRQEILEEILEMVERIAAQLDTHNLGWYVTSAGDRWFFTRARSCESGVLACAYSIEELGLNATREYAMSSSIAFVKNGEYLNSPYWLGEAAPDSLAESGVVSGEDGAQYMIVKRFFLNTEMIYGAPYSPAAWLRLNIISFTAVILLSFLIAYFVLRRNILRPLAALRKTMDKIAAGDLQERSTGSGSAELVQINDTFNHMLDIINQMKIKQYEQKLRSQKLEMDALRLQIRPHFYLNCLKNLYGLSQIGETGALQESILYLSHHLRYTFQIQQEWVPLQQELGMCENYNRLQTIGRDMVLPMKLSVDDSLMEIQVPSASLLTLVENSFKYAFVNEHPLQIRIEVKRLLVHQENLVSLVVADNGPGFDRDTLHALNRDPQHVEDACVGIRNVVRRFELLYGEQFRIAFYNQGGAVIEVVLQDVAPEGPKEETAKEGPATL